MTEKLGDYVRRIRREKNLSTSDVQRNSRGKISDAYVSQIENGNVKNPSLDKLEALAKGLGVAPIEVFRAVSETAMPQSRREILAETFDGKLLTDADWVEIEKMIEFLVGQKKAVREAFADRERPPLKSNFRRKKV